MGQNVRCRQRVRLHWPTLHGVVRRTRPGRDGVAPGPARPGPAVDPAGKVRRGAGRSIFHRALVGWRGGYGANTPRAGAGFDL